MTDYTELKSKADAATQGEWQVIENELPCRIGRPHVERRIFTAKDHPQLKAPYPVVNGSVALGTNETPVHHMVSMTAEDAAFIAAANPAAVLALIAENDRLTNRLEVDPRHDYDGISTRDATVKVLDEQVDQLKAENERLKAESEQAKLISRIAYNFDGYKAVLDERDQLRAEIAGLKTGYEAYERVNAELKAEVEGLRKDADRAAYWKQRAKSAEGHLFSGDFRAAAMELHKYSRFESTPWPELTGSQHALISSAAGAVIATVNRLRDARRPKNRDETDAIIWCACGDGHAANSYGAGFMDANNGVCANCDAALGQGEQS